MALTQKLLIRQSQALVMTPQLMQAIKLLQLSNLDLTAYVETELERNPLLDRPNEEEGDQPASHAEIAAGETDFANGWGDGSTEDPPRTRGGDAEDIDSDPAGGGDSARSRADAEALWGRTDWTGAASSTRHAGEYNLEAFVSEETTLAGHLA